MDLFVVTAKYNAIFCHCCRRKVGELTVAIAPDGFAIVEVNAMEFIFEMAEVSAIADHSDGCSHISASVDFIELCAIGQGNEVQFGIAAAESSFIADNGGSAVDVIAGFERPNDV